MRVQRNRRTDQPRPSPLLWIPAALALYRAVFVITIAVHVPANDAIKAAGEVDFGDLAAVRARFDEAKWATWNPVRAVASLVAAVALAIALRRS